MRRRDATIVPGLLAILALSALPVQAEPYDATGERDVAELMARAQEHYDLEELDAVLLLKEESVDLSTDGIMTRTFHEIVWMGTELAVDRYADLRVPVNTETSTLEITALRTWRDGRWWPDEREISPTAVVETLPYALSSADDYVSIHETMLLHDGVELPCIVETRYKITETVDSHLGADGFWVFPKEDPAVLTRYSVSVPHGRELPGDQGNGAPEPALATSADGARDTHSWTMELVDRLPRPLTDTPASYAPFAAWSTWPNWQALGYQLIETVNAELDLPEAVKDTIAARVRHAPDHGSRAAIVAEYVAESTRYVGYDTRFWQLKPRSAHRTWETAYGHRLDRAVLAAALFRAADFVARPVFLGIGRRRVSHEAPGFSQFEGIGLLVADRETGTEFEAYFDPVHATLTKSDMVYRSRSLWNPRVNSDPDYYQMRGIGPSELRIELTLELGEDGVWTGRGFLAGAGWCSPYDQMVGLGSESVDYLGGVAGSVLDGSDVTEYNFTELEPSSVVAGFAFSYEPDDDERDRITVVAGDPRGGALSKLPSDVRLYHEYRDSPVILADRLSQSVVVRIRTEDVEIVQLPVPVSLENDLGRFSVTVDTEDEWVTVRREFAITIPKAFAPVVAAEDWPNLRTLLLAETSERNRTIILR
jgi:hypothetical protein